MMFLLLLLHLYDKITIRGMADRPWSFTAGAECIYIYIYIYIYICVYLTFNLKGSIIYNRFTMRSKFVK